MIKLKKYLPENLYLKLIKIYNDKFNPLFFKSYAQEGEDLVLNRLINEKEKGFFIDVGAHHPKRFSNTYYFYKKGWRGINIEARPGSKKLFDRYRPRDINLEIPISLTEKELNYYIFNEPALNGFNEEVALKKDGLRDYKIIKKIKLRTKSLKNVLDEYLPKGKSIDFLTVDVEGLDLDVLKSNDWNKYLPKIILVEDSNFSLCDCKKSTIYQFLKSINYRLIARTFNTSFYILN